MKLSPRAQSFLTRLHRYRPTQEHLGYVAFVGSLVALVVATITSVNREAFFRCQVQTNDATIVTLHARAEAATQDQEAVDLMVRSILDLKPGEGAKVRQILQQYTEQRRQANATRAANPLPEPANCG